MYSRPRHVMHALQTVTFEPPVGGQTLRRGHGSRRCPRFADQTGDHHFADAFTCFPRFDISSAARRGRAARLIRPGQAFGSRLLVALAPRRGPRARAAGAAMRRGATGRARKARARRRRSVRIWLARGHHGGVRVRALIELETDRFGVRAERAGAGEEGGVAGCETGGAGRTALGPQRRSKADWMDPSA